MIAVNQLEWYKLKKSLGMDILAGPELPAMAAAIGAIHATFGPVAGFYPWVIFEFKTPEEETFARLKYL